MGVELELDDRIEFGLGVSYLYEDWELRRRGHGPRSGRAETLEWF